MEDVIIVGGGPTGLYLGCQLLTYGLSPLILEKRTVSDSHSKALTINASSLNAFADIGLAEEVLSSARRVDDFYVHYNGSRLVHINFRHLVNRFAQMAMQPQPVTESQLSRLYLESGGRLMRGCAVTSVGEKDDKALVQYVDESGETHATMAQYVAGCDGARSVIREQLGIAFTGHNYPMYFVMADLEIEWDGPRQHVHYFVRDDGFIILIPLTDTLHRIVVKRDGSYDTAVQPTLEDFQVYAERYGPAGIQLKNPIWISSAPFYNRIAATSRRGRIFLAGDAVHLFSPIGGLGMNTGLQDAFNLAWRLAYVLKGFAPETALDAYVNERMAADRLLLQQTDHSTNVIARSDRSRAAVVNYLPCAANRHIMRSVLPQQTSGTQVAYPWGFSIRDDRSGRRNSLVGHLLPYVPAFGKAGVEFGHGRCVLLIFTDDSSTALQLRNRMPSLWQTFLDVIAVGGSTCENAEIYGLADPEGRIARDLQCGAEDFMLVRPDLYVGYIGQVDRFDAFLRFMEGNFECSERRTDQICA